MSNYEQMDALRRIAAGVRSRLKTALKHHPGGWHPSFTVSEYGGNGKPSLRIMLVRRGADAKGLNFAVYWNHSYGAPPSKDGLRDFRYGCRRWKSSRDMSADLADLVNAQAEIDGILPLIWAAFRLANPDKLVQMAGEAEWQQSRPTPARRRKKTPA